MFSNALTFKGKLRVFLSNIKTILLELFDIKKKIFLKKNWHKIVKPEHKTILVIANGPSFNKEIADKILEKRDLLDLIVINDYCLNDFSNTLIPDYYLLSDPKNFDTNDKKDLEINKLIENYIYDNRVKLIAPYKKYLNKKIEPFLFFNDRQNLFSKNINPKFPRGYRSNTGFKAIAIALGLGYDNILLLGLDYDYPRKIRIDNQNKIFLLNEYNFSKDYIEISSYFDSVAHAFFWWSQDYWYLQNLKSPKIKNVTENSMIDVFKRMNFNEFNDFILKLK